MVSTGRAFAYRFQVLVQALLLVGCTATRTITPSVPRPVAATRQVVAAPTWIREYCVEARRKTGLPVLCPTRVPRGLVPTANLERMRPWPDGYVFEAHSTGSSHHWVFAASKGDPVSGYPARRIGSTSVSGWAAEWLRASESAGIHAHHLALTWRDAHFGYLVSAHIDDPRSLRSIRRELLAVARGMARPR